MMTGRLKQSSTRRTFFGLSILAAVACFCALPLANNSDPSESPYFGIEIPKQAALDNLFLRASRIELYDGDRFLPAGRKNSRLIFQTSDKNVISGLMQAMKISTKSKSTVIKFYYDRTIELYSGSDKIAVIGLFGLYAVRKYPWKCDADLVDGEKLLAWYRMNAIPSKPAN